MKATDLALLDPPKRWRFARRDRVVVPVANLVLRLTSPRYRMVLSAMSAAAMGATVRDTVEERRRAKGQPPRHLLVDEVLQLCPSCLQALMSDTHDDPRSCWCCGKPSVSQRLPPEVR